MVLLGETHVTSSDPDEKLDSFEFDSTGEAVEYISLMQARLLAIEHACADTEIYGPRYSNARLVWELLESEEDEDYYQIKLSWRPAGRFDGEPGIEEFIIAKTGEIRLRQLLDEPTGQTVERQDDVEQRESSDPAAVDSSQSASETAETSDPDPEVSAAVAETSLEEARSLTLRALTGDRRNYRELTPGSPLEFEISHAEETQDSFIVTLSFRPRGKLVMVMGQEQFRINKDGTFADRRILNRFSLEEPPKAGTPFVVPDGYEVPTAMRRASAAITDIAVVMVLFIVIALVAAGAGEAGTEEYENTLAGLLVLLFIGCPAFWIFAATEGWSIGKLAVGLRLFGFDGETTGFGAALKRELLGKWLASIPLYVGLLAIIWHPHGLGWHDRLVKTMALRKTKWTPYQ
jgi:uncharacterized RDD family membrane protein YckC